MSNGQLTPAQSLSLEALLEGAFTSHDYDQGYKDAIESMALALLARGVSENEIRAATLEACDAFANNLELPDDEDQSSQSMEKQAG